MGLETATYISDLVATNPLGTDAKSQGDDHLRLLKSTIKATFPNVTGALSATHTELNYVTGVTSAIQTQINTKGAIAGQAWTGSHTFVTQSAGDNSTKAATTAYVDTGLALKGALIGATWTGTQSFTGATITVTTQSPSDNSTKAASTAYVDATAFASALPNQSGNSGKFVTTNGTTASWTNLSNSALAKSANYTLVAADRYKAVDLTSSATLSLTAAATMADGFIFYVRNAGTGVWTIDPNASETIDGRTTIIVYPGEAFAVICDGSNWRCYGRQKRAFVGSVSLSGVATAAFETPFSDGELASVDFEIDGATWASGPDAVIAQLKASGSYLTAGSYNYFTWTASSGAITSGPNQSYLYASQTLTTSGITGRGRLSNATSASAGGPTWRWSDQVTVFEAQGSWNAAITVQGVQFSRSAGGNFTGGTARCYINRL